MTEGAKVQIGRWPVQRCKGGGQSTEYGLRSTEYGGMAGGRRLHGERTRRSAPLPDARRQRGSGKRKVGRCKSANRPMACAKVQRLMQVGTARSTDPTPETGGKGEAGTGKMVGGRRRKHSPWLPGRFALLLHHHEVGPAVEERLLTCVRQDGDEKQKSDATAALKHQ